MSYRPEYAKKDRDRRNALRIIGENGRWYAPNCPTTGHGSWPGIWWGCDCDPCLNFKRSIARHYRQERLRRRARNREMLQRITRDHALPATPSEAAESAPAPEEQEKVPLPPAPTPPHGVEPATPEAARGTPPGPPSYIEQVRAKLLAAGLHP